MGTNIYIKLSLPFSHCQRASAAEEVDNDHVGWISDHYVVRRRGVPG
jgi:hypothetical protein